MPSYGSRHSLQLVTENGTTAKTTEVLPPAPVMTTSGQDGVDDSLLNWHEEFEPQHDKPSRAVKASSRRSQFMVDSVEECITSSLTHMGLERSPAVLVTTSAPSESTCLVPTPLMVLTRHTRRRVATMDNLDAEITPSKEYSMLVSLEPTVQEVLFTAESALAYPTSTLAEAFIQNPQKAWLNNGGVQLKPETSHCDKLLIWARALLVSKDDRSILARAGITRGILGSLYEIPLKWPLIQAFLTFWNSEGHTLVTRQGEMGFPLLALQDSMGIPILGRVYDEYVPDSCFQDEVAAALFSAYMTIRKSKIDSDSGGDGLVTLSEWVDHFLMDMAEVENSPQIPLPPNFYADVDDPLLERLNFRMSDDSGNARPLGVYFSNQVMRFNGNFSRAHLRAAFVAAWLCSYCVPVGAGTLVRPEVFMAAATIANGVRRAIGVASMAYLYESLDAIQGAVRRSVRSASKCRLSLPIHFIMGWFACYWRAMPAEPTSIVSVTNFPPFIADVWRASEIDIDLEGAHSLFLEVNVQQHCLAHLDFLGRLKIRFPEDTPNQIVDRRHAPDNTRQIRISEIDLLVSSTVGGVSHRRCHIHNNQAYCPQRFARMFHCDQVVPDTWMEGLLRFSGRLSGNMNETTELLRRRLLAYWLPDGHTFEAQVRGRAPICSAGYMLWCKSYLGFLKGADSFCAGTTPSPPAKKGKAQVPQIDAYGIASEIVRNSKASLKENAQVGGCSSSAQPPNMEKHEEASTNWEKSISDATASGCSKDVPLVDLTGGTEVVADERQTSTEHTLHGSNIANKKAKKALAGRRKRKSSDNPEGAEDSHAEKACKVDSNSNDTWSVAASKELMEKICSDIKARVEGLDKSAIAEFNANLPSFDPSPDKYDGVPGVTLRASDIIDESQRDFFLYAKQDLQTLQGLASAAELDKSMFAEKIDKVLARWAKLFSDQVSEGMEKMAEALKELRGLLVGEVAPLLPFDASAVAAQKTQVEEALKKATAIQEAIPAALAKIEEVEMVAKIKCEALAACTKHQEEEIAKAEGLPGTCRGKSEGDTKPSC